MNREEGGAYARLDNGWGTTARNSTLSRNRNDSLGEQVLAARRRRGANGLAMHQPAGRANGLTAGQGLGLGGRACSSRCANFSLLAAIARIFCLAPASPKDSARVQHFYSAFLDTLWQTPQALSPANAHSRRHGRAPLESLGALFVLSFGCSRSGDADQCRAGRPGAERRPYKSRSSSRWCGQHLSGRGARREARQGAWAWLRHPPSLPRC